MTEHNNHRRNGMTDPDLSGAIWRKSVRSGGATNCVEIAGGLPLVVAVRDSKDPAGPKLTFTYGAWDTFTASVKSGN
jgi:hypothetical protein